MSVIQQMQQRNDTLKKGLLMELECEKELLETFGKKVFFLFLVLAECHDLKLCQQISEKGIGACRGVC